MLQLSPTARERKVSSTRLQRMISFGTLGIGLGVGTAAEYTRKMLGLKEQSIEDTVDNMFLTKANAERIVSTSCKVRGKIYLTVLYFHTCMKIISIYRNYRCSFKDWSNIKHPS